MPEAVQSVQFVPHLVSVLQVRQAAPLQYLPEPHEPLGAGVALQMQVDPLQLGVVPVQSTQEAPQWSPSLQAVQVPALHQLPEPQSASMLQPTQVVPAVLQILPVAVQSVQEEPHLALVLQVAQVVPLQ